MTACPTHLLAMLAAGTLLAGCGIPDPYHGTARSERTATTTSTTVNDPSDPPAGATGPHGTIPARQRVQQQTLAASAAQPTARAAITLYAQLAINWRGATLPTLERQLAALSLGQARALALQTAAGYGRDTVLQHSQVRNQGQVVSLATGAGPARGRWVIVTSEHTTGQGDYTGLPASLHVTLATATDTRHGWVITTWQPQS